MRKGLLFLAPFALVAGLHMACSSAERRSGFANEGLPDGGGFGSTFDPVDASTDAQGCSESNTEISRIPVVIEFVVDESGSMDSGGKWTALRDALLGAFDDMQTTADPATFVGVLRYGTSVGDKVDPGPLTDTKHYDDLVDNIDTPKAGGGSTATEVALKAAYKIVEDFKPPASTGLVPDKMNRVVVLMSDGEPNGGATEETKCQNLAEEKYTAVPPDGPISTFSVGIGPFPASSGYNPTFMGWMAVKGGTARPDCSPTENMNEAGVCHYQVTPGGDATATKQALVDAINQIRALSASCEFTFTTNKNTDINNVEVEITAKDGTKTKIPKDPENGWSFDDPEAPTKVVLNGEACASSNGTVSGRVDVVIGCRGAN